MKKKIPMIIGLLVIIAFSIWFAFTYKTHKIYDNNVNTASYTDLGVFTEENSLSQTFTCEEDQIDGFLIKCNPSGDYSNAQIELTVKDESGKVLSSASYSGSIVKARKLNKFLLDTPITGYKGQTLTLEVAESNSSTGNGITFFYEPDESSIGDLCVNGSPLSGVFVMKTITYCFDVETFITLLFSILFIWAFMWFLYRLFQ